MSRYHQWSDGRRPVHLQSVLPAPDPACGALFGMTTHAHREVTCPDCRGHVERIEERRARLGLAETTFRKGQAPAHPPGFRPIGGKP